MDHYLKSYISVYSLDIINAISVMSTKLEIQVINQENENQMI